MSTESGTTETTADRRYEDVIRNEIVGALREQWSALPDWELQAAARVAFAAVKPFLDSAWQNAKDWNTVAVSGANRNHVEVTHALDALRKGATGNCGDILTDLLETLGGEDK